MKLLKNTLRIVLPLIFGILIFWWVYRNMDFAQILIIIKKGVAYQWLLLSVIIGIVSHVLRAARWKMLIKQLGVDPSLKTLTNAVFINYGANLILPRLGEIWRCIFVAQKSKTTFAKVFGTLVSERLVDVILVLLMIFAGAFTMMDMFISFMQANVHIKIPFSDIIGSPIFFLSIGILMISSYFIYQKIKHSAFVIKIKVLVHELWIGIKTLVTMPHKGSFFTLSLLIWGAYLLQLYVCFFAFDFMKDLGFGICFSLFVMGSIAFSLPVQGGIGPWHFMIISTLVFYGIAKVEAAAFALIVHTLQTLVNAATGVYAFISTGTTKIIDNTNQD